VSVRLSYLRKQSAALGVGFYVHRDITGGKGEGRGERCGHPGRRNKQQKRDLLFWTQNTLNYLSQISGNPINNCDLFMSIIGDGYYHYSPWVPKKKSSHATVRIGHYLLLLLLLLLLRIKSLTSTYLTRSRFAEGSLTPYRQDYSPQLVLQH